MKIVNTIRRLTPDFETMNELEAEADRKWGRARELADEKEEVIGFRGAKLAKGIAGWRSSYKKDIRRAEEIIERLENENR